jgi:hypothetical protein
MILPVLAKTLGPNPMLSFFGLVYSLTLAMSVWIRSN